MLTRVTKAILVSITLFAAISTDAKPKQWSKHAALAEAEHDIHTNNIRFCYWGGYVPRPVGVPDEYFRTVSKYPKRMVGQGCIVTDEALNERQRVYAEAYNVRMLAYVLEKK
jgi:hypothetical protein